MNLFETLGNALRPENVQPTKILYYVVELELDYSDEFNGTTTGIKYITVYSIGDYKPELFARLECFNGNNSEEFIQGYLNDNGYGDDNFKLINL